MISIFLIPLPPPDSKLYFFLNIKKKDKREKKVIKKNTN